MRVVSREVPGWQSCCTLPGQRIDGGSITERERIAAPAVRVKSSEWAGDSMVAGVVHSLARGRPLGEAVRVGVAAGAAAPC
jgi:sugar/nucleoside kinase (ribokinase family)